MAHTLHCVGRALPEARRQNWLFCEGDGGSLGIDKGVGVFLSIPRHEDFIPVNADDGAENDRFTGVQGLPLDASADHKVLWSQH
jgi:hypothetical protein